MNIVTIVDCEEKGQERQGLLTPVSPKNLGVRSKKKFQKTKKPQNSSRKQQIPTGRPLGSPHVKILPEMVGVDMKRQNLSANTNTDKCKYNGRQ